MTKAILSSNFREINHFSKNDMLKQVQKFNEELYKVSKTVEKQIKPLDWVKESSNLHELAQLILMQKLRQHCSSEFLSIND